MSDSSRVLADEFKEVSAIVGKCLFAYARNSKEVLGSLWKEVGNADDGFYAHNIAGREVAGLGDGFAPI